MKTKAFKIQSIIAVVLALSVMLSLPVSSYAADTVQPGTIVKNEITTKISKDTKLRKAANANSKILLSLKKGKKVKVTSFSGNWLYVSVSTKEKTVKGYVGINFVEHGGNYVIQKTSLSIDSGSKKKLKTLNLNGESENSNVTWSSSNKNIAKVSKSGNISGMGLGKAKIYATKAGKTYVCNVTVSQKLPEVYYTYSVNKKVPLYKDKKKSKKLVTVPKNAAVSFIKKEGKFTRISYVDKKKKKFTGYVETPAVLKKKNTVTVKTNSIEVVNPTETLIKGQSRQLTVQLEPLNATQKVTWTTSNANVISVTESGLIKAVNYGTAKITAKSGSVNYGFQVEVPKPGIKINYPTVLMTVGASYRIIRNTTFILIDTSGTVCTSSNPSVATINGGTIYAKSLGNATITVKKGNYVSKFNVYVHPVSQNAQAPINTFFYTDTNYNTEAYENGYIPLEEYAPEYSYGSDGATHPDCLFFAQGFNGYKYWMTYTPYPAFEDGYENPCILVSNDLENWKIPEGGINPIEPRPYDHKRANLYNSDTDLVYNPTTKQIECWWRKYVKKDKKILIYRKCSKDGVHWGNKELMISSDNMSKKDYLSPAVLFENGVYKMWSVDPRNDYKVVYQEFNPKTKTWSKERIIKIEYTSENMQTWHLSVTHTPKGYEMAISASKSTAINHQSMDLYYCYSTDNKDYTMADTMLQPSRSTHNWDNQGIYRSTLLYANGKYYLFYPGLTSEYGQFGNPMGIAIISGNDPFYLK